MPSVLPVPNPTTWNPRDWVTAGRLRSDVSSAVAFHTGRPFFSAIQSTTPGVAQSVPSSTWAGVTLNKASTDTAGGHSNSTNPSRYVCQVAGWYLAVGSVAYPSSATAQSNCYIAGIRVNGSNAQGNLFEGGKHPGANNHTVQPMVFELVKLNVGDYVELAAFQVSGAAVTLNTSIAGPNVASSLTLTWVAAISGTTGLAVPSEATWTDGTVITAAALNSNVRDAVRFLTYPPIARIYYNNVNPANQFIGTNAWVALAMDAVTIDNYSGWPGIGPNQTRWTAPVAGHYLLATYSAIVGAVGGKRACALRVNGTTTYYGQAEQAIAAAGNDAGNTALTTRLLKLNAGDYVEVLGFQNSGGSQYLATGTNCCRLIAVWMCA